MVAELPDCPVCKQKTEMHCPDTRNSCKGWVCRKCKTFGSQKYYWDEARKVRGVINSE